MLGEAVNAGGGGEDMGSPPANCGNAARGPGASASADAPGDCWPHVIIRGEVRFHSELIARPAARLSPGKIDRFTPARALDMRASREGAR